MKKIYIAVIAVLVMSVLLFMASFVYLDKAKRRTCAFIVSMGARAVGTIRVDKFITEDKLIYKSFADMPFAPLYTEIRSRLDLGKRYVMDSYEREMVAGRSADTVYIRNSNGLVSFIEKYRSRFAFVDNIPTKKDTFIFEEDSPMTYMPILANYDFSKGRSQVFHILTPQEPPGLPPVKRILTLTSIRDEYLKVDSRKIKTEHLVLKMRDSPQSAVWVAKSDRAIIKIELPHREMAITRSFRPRTIRAARHLLQDPRYLSKEVVFKSRGVELSGTLTVPSRDGRFPAVLLVSGDTAADRDLEGFFASIADHLSKNGICVLRFDRRGIGTSKGDSSTSTDSEEAQDIAAALDCLRGLGGVDPKNIAVAGYEKGALYALRASSEQSGIKGLILISPALCGGRDPQDIEKVAAASRWSDDYKALAIRMSQATADKVKNAKGAWTGILGSRCYVNGMREETCDVPVDQVGRITGPVLILQGDGGRTAASGTAIAFHKAFTDAGNTGCTLITLDVPGHFFGSLVNDGTHRLRYEPDEKALESLRSWLATLFGGATP